MSDDKKVTIYDVAAMAGVSTGTVDRVIYNRGRVSASTAQRVSDAIKTTGYSANLYASVLASKVQRTIACLLPAFSPKQYWDEIYQGFIEGVESVKSFNIRPEVRFYDQYDEGSFIKACDEILQIKPDAVVFYPFFTAASAQFSSMLYEKGIPYGYVDGKIEDDHYLVYYGSDLYKSGSFCAHILCDRQQFSDVLIVRIKRHLKSDPTYNRRKGFVDYIEKNFPGCRIHCLSVNPNDKGEICHGLGCFFARHPDVKFVMMPNSRVHLIADYCKDNPMEGRFVIGFDSIEENVSALREGYVNALVTRQISMQSFNVVTSLAYYIIQGRVPASKDNYMHIDILTRYNLDEV